MQLLLAATFAAAAASAQILSLPLTRRAEGGDALTAIQQEIAAIEAKYGQSNDLSKRKRATNVAITGITELANYNIDLLYQVELTVGSNAQKVKVQLDSGSSDLWLAQKGCVQCNVQDATLFDGSTSSSYSNSGEGFQPTYSSAAIRCTKASDTVSIAGLKVSADFGVCDAQVGMVYPASLGILGLGFQANAKSGSKPWIQEAYEQGVIESPAFAVSLASSQSGATRGNQLTLGGYDEKAISGDIAWLEGQSTKFWSVALDAVSFNGQSVYATAGEQMQTVVDTGTSLVTGPPAAVKLLYSTVPGAQEVNGAWQFPCANTPSVSFRLGGKSYAIPKADMIRGYTDASKQTCLGSINAAVIANDVSQSVGWLLGDTFLKSVYTIFDMSENKIGFAQKSGSVSQSGGFTKVPMTLVTSNTPAGNFAPAKSAPQQVSQQKFSLGSDVPSIKATVPHAAGLPFVARKAQVAPAPEQQVAAPIEEAVQATTPAVVAAATPEVQVQVSSAVASPQAQTSVAAIAATSSTPAVAITSVAAAVSSLSPTSRGMTTMTRVAASSSSIAQMSAAASVAGLPATVPASSAGTLPQLSISCMLAMSLGSLLLF